MLNLLVHHVTSRLLKVNEIVCVIWGFRREVTENCAILGYYAASSGNSGKKLHLIAA